MFMRKKKCLKLETRESNEGGATGRKRVQQQGILRRPFELLTPVLDYLTSNAEL